jgi:hypothetical protein
MRKFLLAVLVAVIAASLGVGLAFASVHKRAPSKAGSAALHANALASDPVLLGDSSVAGTSDGGKGTSESFGYTATTTGTATNLNAYLTSKTGAGLGLYATSGSKPGALLGSCSLASNTVGWMSCNLSKGVAITAGTRYWIAVYAGSASKTIAYRDMGSKGSNLDYSGTGRANPYAIVHQWSSNPASLYVGGTTGTTTSTTTTPTTTTTTPTTTTTTTTPTTSTTTSTTTTAPPPRPSGAIVGVAADPVSTCAETVSAASGLDAALSSAPAGSTVCLQKGTTFGNISFDTVSTKAVTVDGQGDTVGGVSVDAAISNLTIQGMNSQGFNVLDPTTNITIQYSNVENIAQGIGVHLDSGGHGASGTITGTVIRYNQFDNIGSCLDDVRDQTSTTFSHNVCGPGLGFGAKNSGDPGHYVQTGGEDNMVVDNNAFIGPPSPDSVSAGLHLNVFHDWGTSNHVDFSNNLLWHDGAIGQAILFQTGHFDNVTVDNNVAVEQGAGGSNAYAFWLDTTHTGSFNNNTTVDSYWGNLITIAQASSDYSGDTGLTVANNLTTGTTDNPDCGFSSDVTQSTNYTGDGCSGKTFNGQWQTTSYAPSLPYSAPPAGWYQPSGLTGVGYQGTVGP